jgi:chromosomal replication initiation ATPase DnaA
MQVKSEERIDKLERQVERLLGDVTALRHQIKAMTPKPYQADLLPYLRAVCRRHGLTPEQAMSKERTAHVVACRRDIWHNMHMDGWSMAKIARAFGTDHGTVKVGIERFVDSLSARG